ncbi:hypothetical protein K3495_g7615 [Podosphaera aphanis]|nr:hypothetical protein K3495_g7615 [Podosphaera aphanis]
MRPPPNGFLGQPQMSQNRGVSGRIPPSSKMVTNGTTWSFGGVPMGSNGLGVSRSTPQTSFTPTIGGSIQPSTPLNLSDFPSLSDNQSQPSQSTWTASGSRGNIGPSSNNRLSQQTALSTQQQTNAQQQTQLQQEDLFNSSSQLPSNQARFRFGTQNPVGQASQSHSVEEFPPLNRNGNGEISQDSNLSVPVSSVTSTGPGFSSKNSPPTRNNVLLNALSSGTRGGSGNNSANRATPTTSLSSGAPNSRTSLDPNRQHLNGAAELEQNAFLNSKHSPPGSNPHALMSRTENLQQTGLHPQRSNINFNGQINTEEPSGHDAQGILSGMSEIDRWGLKGFSMMMNNFPAYAALVTGSDLTGLGLELSSSELISNQVYSLWDNDIPRLPKPPFKLPECYTVSNVAQLETKMTNFNDEALIFMFYSNPGDLQQVMAAQELHNRNWRYHKKLQLWLTKDDMMVPQTIGNGTERGYYIFFDIKNWQRERREFTLVYDDLESLPNANPRLG